MSVFRNLVSVPAAAGVALIGLVSGCGGGAHPVAATGVEPTPDVTSRPAQPSVVPSAAGSTRGNPSAPASSAPSTPGSTPTPARTYPQYVQGTKQAPVDVTLQSTCTTKGGSQVLTVSAPAGFYLSADAQYSDQNDGRKYGGYYVGKIPASGSYRLPWLVSPKAPMGKVTVWIAVEGGHPTETAFRQPTFVVAKSC